MEGTSVEETTRVGFFEYAPDFDPEKEGALEKRLEFLYGKEVFRPGLQRIQKALSLFGLHPEEFGPHIVTIAGTNGKGETSMCLAWHLKQLGIPYALWTSPHVLSLRERFQSPHGQISYAELLDLIEWTEQKLLQAELKLSYFEFLFVLFLSWAQMQRHPGKPSVLILEVGLGGRLDAVNVLNAHLTAIVSISRDHEEILGHGYRKILKEKWGITRKGVPLLTTLDLDYLQALTEELSLKEEVPWRDLIREGKVQKKDSYSVRNQALALELLSVLLDQLKLSPTCALTEVPKFKARGEVWPWGAGELIFYGSHNPDGLRQFVEYWKGQENSIDGTLFAFSQRSFKDLKVMCSLIQELPGPHWGTTFEHVKAAKLQEILPASLFLENWKSFLVAKRSVKEVWLITGSYYFVGQVQSFLASFK